jgi:hypothetical protein
MGMSKNQSPYLCLFSQRISQRDAFLNGILSINDLSGFRMINHCFHFKPTSDEILSDSFKIVGHSMSLASKEKLGELSEQEFEKFLEKST